MIQAVVFDMDGTVLDTLKDLSDAVNDALQKLNLPGRTEEDVRSYLGNGMSALLKLSLPENASEEPKAKATEYFGSYYKAHCNDNTAPYEGIPELMHSLRQRGIKIAIASNKPDFAVQVLKQDYFNGLTDEAIGETAGMQRKPAPDMVWEVLDRMGVSKEQAVYVGDSEVDLKTAGNAGLTCLSVTWGFRSREQLMKSGAKHLIDRPEEILSYVLGERK